jgi:hypothetical protein
MGELLYGVRVNVIQTTQETGEVFDHEDDGITRHRNVRNYTPNDTASHARRLYSSAIPLRATELAHIRKLCNG